MITAILQARVSSRRLRGKVMMDLAGAPMLQRQIERIRKAQSLDRLIVATSTDSSDDAIASLCAKLNVDCYRGSLNDVLARFAGAAEIFHLRDDDHIVRLTADCPLFDPDVLDKLVGFYQAGKYDYASNIFEPTFPDGLDCEVFTVAALKIANREANSPVEREHVTPFIFLNRDRFRVGSFKNKVDQSAMRWTVDEKEDLDFVSRVYAKLYPTNPDFGMEEIVGLLHDQPELQAINAKFERSQVFSGDTARRIELIAEIAQGYEGKPRQAELMALGAVKAGADAVKFQLVFADELATPDYVHYPLFRDLEMSLADWKKVASIVHSGGCKLYFDVFGFKSLSVAMELKAEGIKLSTTEFYNEDLVRKTLEVAPRVLISIGGIPIADIERLIEREKLVPSEKITFLYGFQAEPTPLDQNSLMRIVSLRQRFPGFRFGFMDHSDGASEDALMLPIMALSTGIDLIEKHLTLDYAMQLEDYVSALSPTRFAEFTRLIRKFETALGKPDLTLTDLELQYAAKATKIAVAVEPIPAGAPLSANNIALKRIGETHRPSATYRRLSEVLDRKAARPIAKDEPISDNIL